MKNVLDQLHALQAAHGLNAKKAFLATVDEDFKWFLQAALDPYKMYGVRTFDNPGNRHISDWSRDGIKILKDLLAQLHSRELTGNKAKDACTTAQAHGVPRELIEACLTKDIRAGVAVKSINEVFPDLIPEFLVALCEPYDPVRTSFPVLVSTKYDGLRCLAFCQENGAEVQIKTRNGLPIPAAEPLKEYIWNVYLRYFSGYGSVVFDGEILTTTFQQSVSDLRSKSKVAKNATFVIFDWLKVEDFLAKARTEMDQLARNDVLQSVQVGPEYPVQISKEKLCWTHDRVMAEYEIRRAKKLEGVIVKQNHAYSFGRSYSWMKVKAVETKDCRVVGLEEGKGKYKGTLGKLVVQWTPELTTTLSGMLDKDRDAWWAQPNLILDKMVEVLYQNETDAGLPRHGRFACVRWDKS